MYGKRGRELRRCQAITLGGFGTQCRNFSKVGFNLCSIHLAADNRHYPDEATKAFNKVMSKRNRIGKKKTQYLRCHCQAYPFVHPAGGGEFCQWPYQPKQRLECKTDLEAVAIRRKLRRKGVTVNTIRELASRGIGEESKVVDLDFDPTDLSLEEDYLSRIEYEVDVLSLPIEKRRKIQKQKMIADYLARTDNVTLVDGETEKRLNVCSTDGNSDNVEIGGQVYRLK
jgi:hypothetical protein